jgi:hypothetical protein
MRDMSHEFPDVAFVGVDLLPIQNLPLPSNCRVEIDDFNLGLEHFYDSFNLVHGRVIAAGVRNYQVLIDEISKVLQPSGMILLQEYSFLLADASHRPIQIPLPPSYSSIALPPTKHHPSFVYAAFWVWLLQQCFAYCEGMDDPVLNIERWVRENGAFEQVESTDYFLPIGRWYNPPASQNEREYNAFGERKQKDLIALMASTRQLILDHGMTLEDWHELETNVIREFTVDSHNLKMSARLNAVWGRRK